MTGRSSPSPVRRCRRHGAVAAFARVRAYPAVQSDVDPFLDAVLLAAMRALLRAKDSHDVVDVVATLVRDMGGAVVPARLEPRDALPVDVSLGESEPLVPVAAAVSVARVRLERVLPTFVDDARTTVERLRALRRQAEQASTDPLTGLVNRRGLGPSLAEATASDVVCVVDIDHFKQVNDQHGHAAGDDVLRILGRVLARHVRADDVCARYGGEEMVLVLDSVPVDAAVRRLAHLRREWAAVRPLPVTFSAGLAPVVRDGRSALHAADAALYRAKAAGRDRIEVARPADYPVADDQELQTS